MASEWFDAVKMGAYYRRWLLRNSLSFDDLINKASPTLADGVYFLRVLGEHGCWLQTEQSSFRRGPDHMEFGRFLHESDYFEVRMRCDELEGSTEHP